MELIKLFKNYHKHNVCPTEKIKLKVLEHFNFGKLHVILLIVE